MGSFSVMLDSPIATQGISSGAIVNYQLAAVSALQTIEIQILPGNNVFPKVGLGNPTSG
jgi:hypothetical protein